MEIVLQFIRGLGIILNGRIDCPEIVQNKTERNLMQL